MSLHPGTDRYNPAGNSDFTRRAEKLAREIGNWSTPKATDGTKGGPGQRYGAGGTPPLPAQAILWPTPAAQNWKGSSPASVTRADGKSRMDILHYRAEQGFSRPDPLNTPRGRKSLPHAPISRPLWAWLTASHGRATSRRLLRARAKRRLNPLFTEWLMGWAVLFSRISGRKTGSHFFWKCWGGHTLCACSATAFARWQQHMRGALSQLPMASGPWIWIPTEETTSPVQMEFFDGDLS